MKKISSFIYVLVVFISLFAISSCDCKKEQPSRTVLVYIAGNNNLSQYASSNLADIKSGYLPTYFKPGKSGDALLVYYHGRGAAPKLLRLYKGSKGEVVEELIYQFPEQNSVTLTVMSAVLKKANEMFPADENGLILWSHGTGWLPKGYYSRPTTAVMDASGEIIQVPISQEIDPDAHLVKSFGEENGYELEIADLRKALPIKYSYIIFDACFMGGVEVAYELRDKSDYFIASSAEIMAQGFPYTTFIEPLFAVGKANLPRVCELFYNYYSGQTAQVLKSATISLIKSSELEPLAQSCKTIFTYGRDRISALDMTKIQGYFRMNKIYYYDLDDFMRAIAEPADYNTFSLRLSKAVIYKANTPWFMQGSTTGFEIKRFSGLSTYIPKPQNITLSTFYSTLLWNKTVAMVE